MQKSDNTNSVIFISSDFSSDSVNCNEETHIQELERNISEEIISFNKVSYSDTENIEDTTSNLFFDDVSSSGSIDSEKAQAYIQGLEENETEEIISLNESHFSSESINSDKTFHPKVDLEKSGADLTQIESKEENIFLNDKINNSEIGKIIEIPLRKKEDENLKTEEINKNRELNFSEERFDLLETALEIRYSSLKLDKIPIEMTTLKEIITKTIVKSFGVTDIKIANNIIRGLQVKILKLNSEHYIEIKNREFRLGLEIDLKEDWSFTVINRNYYYKIYENINLIRFKNNVELLKNIFNGEKLSFFNEGLSGGITTENRIEIMKFELLSKEIEQLSFNKKEKLIYFQNSFYKLALLNLLETTTEFDSWVNLSGKLEKLNVEVGDRLSIERVHVIDGNKFNIKEKIKILAPLSEQEFKDKELKAYRKTCRISLEKLYE